jgi:hypothetical protein
MPYHRGQILIHQITCEQDNVGLKSIESSRPFSASGSARSGTHMNIRAHHYAEFLKISACLPTFRFSRLTRGVNELI